MEVLAEEGTVSFPDVDEVSSVLKRESRTLWRIKSLADALEKVNNFLRGPDAKSVEKLTCGFVESWSEKTEGQDATVCFEECFLKLSKIFQERRVINFFRRAERRLSKVVMNRNQPSERKKMIENFERKDNRSGIVEGNNQRLLYSFMEEYVDSVAKDIVVWLSDGTPSLTVLPIEGPSGIGKTTVARKVYDCKAFVSHFDSCCWVEVSTVYEIKDVIRGMIRKMAQEALHDEVLDGMRMIELIGTLRKALQPKRYVLVFDNVGQEEFWNFIKQCLPDNRNGSRIIITTTNYKVVDSCKEGSIDKVCKLGPLSDTESRDLFCRIAFQDEPEQQCPTELQLLSDKILKLCQGFPLPIAGVAGLLSKKEKLVSKWQILYNNLKHKVETNLGPPRVLDIFALSYHDLPNHLRPCFLYFSLFPKNSMLPIDKLFKLWIVEGFVEENGDKTIEEIAKEYLSEFVLRGFVQPCQGFYGIEQYFQVDNLMHSIAYAKADEQNFSSTWNRTNSLFKSQSRRLSVYNAISVLDRVKGYHTRSVFIHDVRAIHNSFVSTLCKNCEFLTLLEFEDCALEHLPEELGNLYNLKYLSLKRTLVASLPKSMHKLRNLEILDVRNTPVAELPVEINSLKNLKHLLASESTRGVRICEGIGELESLHTLTTVGAHKSGIGIVKELTKLKKLRALGISGLTLDTAMAFCNRIDEFEHLESLTLHAININIPLNLQNTSPRLPLLRHLVLKGMLQELGDWTTHLQNLSTLCLCSSRIIGDPLTRLSQLPNLVSLWLYRAFEGEQLYFEEGSFRKLKLLVLRELHGLNALEIEDGALPSLEELRIGSSRLLNEVPYGIQYLRRLRVLANFNMPREFVLAMQPNGGSDYPRVEHIPSVAFWYRADGKRYMVFELGSSDLMNHLQGMDTNSYQVMEHYEHELSFCEGDDEEYDYVRQSSLSSNQSIFPQKSPKHSSFSSTFYTDDVEE